MIQQNILIFEWQTDIKTDKYVYQIIDLDILYEKILNESMDWNIIKIIEWFTYDKFVPAMPFCSFTVAK